MGAETLRKAAALMREEHGPGHKRHAMWAAMADWLYSVASRHSPRAGAEGFAEMCPTCRDASDDSCPDFRFALVLARTYLEAGR